MLVKDLIAEIDHKCESDKLYIINICKKGCTAHIIEYIMEYYRCSEYVASRVAEHYIKGE